MDKTGVKVAVMAILSDSKEPAQRIMDRAGLSLREKYVVWARILAEEVETLENIGRKFDVSRERIRQIEYRACWKIHDNHTKEV